MAGAAADVKFRDQKDTFHVYAHRPYLLCNAVTLKGIQ